MHQQWGKLLFMHWPLEPSVLRPLIPDALDIDTFDGKAWIAIVPFTMWGVRFAFSPAVPWLSSFHELNVRTYVHHQGVPGVWFLSLDTNSLTTVMGGRATYHLPYFLADIDLRPEGGGFHYELRRANRPAQFSGHWEPLGGTWEAQPSSLEFFLVERYCLYSSDGHRLYRACIHHRPWPLQGARLVSWQSTMLESHGLVGPTGDPLLHYADAIAVEVWPLERLT